MHFEKDAFLFSRFGSKTLTHRPDDYCWLFNDFLYLKLLLCVFRLQHYYKRKLTEIKAKGGNQAINTILADIYGRQYNTIKINGHVASKDANDLVVRLESLR